MNILREVLPYWSQCFISFQTRNINMHFLFIFVSVIVSITMAAPVNPNYSSAVTSMAPIVTGSSVYMYSPFYFLTAKLKLLPKHIIMCIINPTMCDESPPTGYIAPASETKVPYIETPVGQPPHVDIFDTSLQASSRLQNGVNEISPSEVEPVESKQNSIPNVRLETEELTSQNSSEVNLENFAVSASTLKFLPPSKLSGKNPKSSLMCPNTECTKFILFPF